MLRSSVFIEFLGEIEISMDKAKKYYIGYSDILIRHAGSKAKIDISRILDSKGFIPIILPRTRKMDNKFLETISSGLIGLRRILKLFFGMPSNSIMVINHPFDFVSMNFAFIKIVKRNKVILINHDLDFCRASNAEELKNEPAEKYQKLYNLAAGLIVPEPTIPTVKEIGVTSPYISPLKIFPYLFESSEIKDKSFTKTVAFTGNLLKSKFINNWISTSRSYVVELIGINGDSLNIGENAIYKGSFEPDIVPFKIDSSFGLVWDGDSIETCSGNYGNYLRYNCPHKLSLYLSIGIPVFIWREAGMAGFVEKNKVGFLIDSLSDIDKILADMTEEKYKEMQENIKPIQKKITDGSYLVEALDDVLSRI